MLTHHHVRLRKAREQTVIDDRGDGVDLARGEAGEHRRGGRNAAISFAGIAGRSARRSLARRRTRACLRCRAIAAIVLGGIATPGGAAT